MASMISQDRPGVPHSSQKNVLLRQAPLHISCGWLCSWALNLQTHLACSPQTQQSGFRSSQSIACRISSCSTALAKSCQS
jgi:hypothetical protein